MIDVLRAEWTKFRSVRGWVIGAVAVVLLTVLVGLIGRSECSYPGPDRRDTACTLPLGPDGMAVTDTFYFVHQPLTGDGSITAHVASLTGELHSHGETTPVTVPWSKAGVMIKEATSQGSSYAAVLVTGDHGVRMQHDFSGDRAGSTTDRWLRLERKGNTITGYEGSDGSRWTPLGSVTLHGSPATVQIGLFVTSPQYTETEKKSLGGVKETGGATVATGTFDDVSLRGPWSGSFVGSDADGIPADVLGYTEQAGTYVVKGSGDIAPVVPGGPSAGATITQTLTGTFAGLIVVIVLATLFITTEYRRGLIRLTLAASPRRGRVLVAKAIVIGAVTFVGGLIAAGIAVPLGKKILKDNGNFVLPVSTFTEVRVMVGTAALLAVSAVLALGIAAAVRRSASAVTAVIVAIVLPYLLALAPVLPVGVSEWLLRVTPAAAFSIQQSVYAYPQVARDYTPFNGFFPLPPLGGFAVLCLYAAAALGLAIVLMRRRDA
jgi:ABC-type transport system involved in multi-copper enzyme maturation permease subunit